MDSAPLILTILFDDASGKFFDALRKKYFPPERNFLSAHCTLFHHLPADGNDDIRGYLTEVCQAQSSFNAQVEAPKFIGRGVAYPLLCDRLKDLHKKMQQRWKLLLTLQDQQGLWPHITVQNKVSPSEGRSLQELLESEFDRAPKEISIQGFSLWAYRDGPWEWIENFMFRD